MFNFIAIQFYFIIYLSNYFKNFQEKLKFKIEKKTKKSKKINIEFKILNMNQLKLN